jgi:hypothetical protein
MLRPKNDLKLLVENHKDKKMKKRDREGGISAKISVEVCEGRMEQKV